MKNGLLSKLEKFLFAASSIASPMKCFLCEEVVGDERFPVCSDCMGTFLAMFKKRCHVCNRVPLWCRCHIFCLDSIFTVLFWYKDPRLKDAIYRFKHQADLRHIVFLAKLIAERLPPKRRYDAVCYVPRKYSSINQYGYDQSRLLAKYIAETIGVPLIHPLVTDVFGKEQKSLSSVERLKNTKNRYRVKTSRLYNKNGVLYKNLLLVDDVVTTGATMLECSTVLKRAGVANVDYAAVAKTAYELKKAKRVSSYVARPTK